MQSPVVKNNGKSQGLYVKRRTHSTYNLNPNQDR